MPYLRYEKIPETGEWVACKTEVHRLCGTRLWYYVELTQEKRQQRFQAKVFSETRMVHVVLSPLRLPTRDAKEQRHQLRVDVIIAASGAHLAQEAALGQLVEVFGRRLAGNAKVDLHKSNARVGGRNRLLRSSCE